MLAFFRLIRSMLSKSSREKIRVCPGKTLTGDISKCPFARWIYIIGCIYDNQFSLLFFVNRYAMNFDI